MNCKICKLNASQFHTEIVLGKYKVSYFKCDNCNFIQTEDPYWLKEAYNSAITHLDIGLIQRNLYLKEKIPQIIDVLFSSTKTFIDYGGGYGMFVRIMRDLGFNFFRYDIYCENLFAKHFDFKDSPNQKFDVLTAFEVFEHLENPIDEITKMFKMSDSIIFSTHLIPETTEEFKKWWYVAPQTGQHVAFYHERTFQHISKLLECNYYSNSHDLHILTRNKFSTTQIQLAFKLNEENFFDKLFGKKNAPKRESLLQIDFEYIKKLHEDRAKPETTKI